MRHRKRGRGLGRTSAHRVALRRNLVSNLFLVERIRTTPAKAKEVRSLAEKLITLGRKGDLASFRRALALLDDKFIVRKLFREIAPRYRERPGGYTRILHLPRSNNRLGDNAEQVLMELVPGTAAPEETAPAAEEAGAESK
jgi:large subunit ribosomal protein L17